MADEKIKQDVKPKQDMHKVANDLIAKAVGILAEKDDQKYKIVISKLQKALKHMDELK